MPKILKKLVPTTGFFSQYILVQTEYGDTDQRRIQKRSSHRGCFVRKGVLTNFIKLTEKHLCQSLFLNKVTS